MTSRRAFFNGTRAARLLAALRRNGGSAAFMVAGSLLLPVCAVPAAFAVTRVNHTHHASAPSAGRAQAHVVHDEDFRSSRAPGKSSSRKDRHIAESSRTETGERASRDARSSAAHRSAATPRHSRDSEDSRHASKAPAKARAGHKRHDEEPIDDPVPVRRADARHGRHELPRETAPARSHGTYAEAATQKPISGNSHRSEPIPGSSRSVAARMDAVRTDAVRTEKADLVAEDREPTPAPGAPAVLPVHNGTPGNVARNLARRSGHSTSTSPTAPAGPGPAAENLTGVSQPDDDERLPMGSPARPSPLSESARRQAAVAAAFARPMVSAPSSQPMQSNTGAVEGFGSEIDFRSPATQPGTRPAALAPIAPPRGTPAEQALSLREAAEVASKPMFVPLYNRDGRLLVPPPLKGSRDILVHQNQMADDSGLTRIQDDADLARMRRAHLLVDLEDSASLRINEGLPENRRAARPWAVRFANDIASAFYQHFGEALQVNSAVRTVAYQLRLQRTNGNAAAVDGEGASPHLTGQALDFGKRGMSVAQIAWMRSYLMPLIEAGKIDVEEEFQQACFHISIYSTYVPATHKRVPARTELAQAPRPAHTHSAAADVDNDMH